MNIVQFGHFQSFIKIEQKGHGAFHTYKHVVTEIRIKKRTVIKVALNKLSPGGLLETLLVTLSVDVTYAAVACLQAK